MTLVERGHDNEPHWRPAAIYCVNVKSRKFFVHGFDRTGKPLTSSDPHSYFMIACKDGVNLTKSKPREQKVEVPGNKTASRVFLFESPDVQATVAFLKRLIPTLLWTGAGTSAFWLYLSGRIGCSRRIKSCSLVASAISLLSLLAWYGFLLQPPE
jgi:hypothetical protein